MLLYFVLTYFVFLSLVVNHLLSSYFILSYLVLCRLQMMEWASSVYHAISIANGGAYVLQYERDRVAAEEEVMLFFTLIDISLSLIRPPKMLIPKY